MNYRTAMKKLWPDVTEDAMAGRVLILMAWTLAAAVTGSDGQCNSTTPTQLVAEQGKISFLDFQLVPSNTTNNTVCQWVISSSNSTRLRLTAATFDLRSENGSCVDIFTVYDGNTSYSPLLLSTCSGLGSPIYSTGSDLFISFNPGKTHTNTKPRFAIIYEPSSAACSSQVQTQTVNLNSQTLQYPASSSNYPTNTDCAWLLQTASYDYVVHVIFPFLDTDRSSNCSYDYVELFDGSTRYSTSLGKVCGQTLGDFYSSGQDMYIKFHSDGNVTGKGFQLTYQAVSRWNVSTTSTYTSSNFDFGAACSSQVQTQTVNLNSQTLQYPASSSNYTVNTDCGWLLQTTSYDYVVHVTFTFLDTELSSNCSYDYVELFDGSTSYSTSLGKVCGQTLGDFYSSGQYMYIKFHSDGSRTGRGFRLTYQAMPHWNVTTTSTYTSSNFDFGAACSSQVQIQTVNLNSQTLQYPASSSNYTVNTDCAWLLQTTSYDYVVHVTFTFLDTELSSSCSYDYVELFDGSTRYSTSLGKVCGQTLGAFYSSGQYMYIKFHSDGSRTGIGFRLTYQAVPNWNVPTISTYASANFDFVVPCSGEVQTRTVNFNARTLQYPVSSINYPTNTECVWLLQTTNYDYVVHVTFTFLDTELSSSCSYDYVELLDGSPTYSTSIGKVCGRTLGDFYSNGQYMYIKFHSDGSRTGRGFQLTYQAVYRWNVPTTSTYTSTNFDFEYHSDLNVGAIVGLALGSSLGFIALTAIFVLVRRRQLQQPTTTIATSADNDQPYTYPYPPTSAPTVAPFSVGAGPPAYNALFPPSGAGYSVNGVHPMSSPQQQFVPQAVYPAFGHPSGANITGANTQAPGGIRLTPGAQTVYYPTVLSPPIRIPPSNCAGQGRPVNLSFSMEVAGPVCCNTSPDSL